MGWNYLNNKDRLSVKTAETVMATESPYTKKWCYEHGLVLKALEKVWQATGEERYFDFIRTSTDKFVEPNGVINTYKPAEYNIDHINFGKVLFALFEKTGDARYRKAMDTLMQQLAAHPRTNEGGFWHKNIYPHQMWLDGIYMASPFYAEFTKKFGRIEDFDDIANQIILADRHMRDKGTGLLYHGWDESRSQKWSNPDTGYSPNFWGRAMGWYAMAIVDVLDFMPEGHYSRDKILKIFNTMAEALLKYQDKETGMWYQLVDKGNSAGNYLETSATSMFVYALAKAARCGYADSSFKKAAMKAYEGIVMKYVVIDQQGLVNINGICKVAGLGGNPYRDGSYEYYVNEPVVTNDYKGVGPFIMASVECENI